MKRLFFLLIMLSCLLFSAGAVSVSADAVQTHPVDVGNFNDYGDGGGDWGGGTTDWGWDDDDNTGAWVGGGSSSGGGGSFSLPVFVVGIGIIVLFLLYKSAKKKDAARTGARTASNMGSSAGMPKVPDNTAQIASALRKYDPNFSMDEFLGWTKEVFITLQEAWTEKDWEIVRPFEKEFLYQQHAKQLQEYKNMGRTNVIERININHAYFYAYNRDKEYEYLKVYMAVRMNDYIVDDRTGAVIKGNKERPCYLQYILTFMRKTGLTTGEATGEKKTIECPHCGAPVEITSSGKCEFCGHIITTGQHDWVLSDMMGVKPGVPIGPGGVRIQP